MSKFNEYCIKINYMNKDTEVIKYTDKGLDKCSYKSMLQIYKQTKEEYKDMCVTIDFVGISSTGELNILFTKEIINEEEAKQKEIADRLENCETLQILKNLKDNFELLNKRRGKVKSDYNIANKERDVKSHQIENFPKDSEDMLEKIKLFNSFQKSCNKRREVKDELQLNDDFFDNSNVCVKHMINILDSYIEKSEKKLSKEYKPLTDEMVEEYKIMKVVKFRSFSEKFKLLSKLNKEYSKAVANDSNMTITCYNKSR